MRIEVPLGDVVDRVTILDLKAARIDRPEAVANVERERAVLRGAWAQAGFPPMAELPEWDELVAVNTALWDVEDALREHEARGDFGEAFVDRARSVYRLNDRRAALKRSVNLRLDSALVEEKSYAGGPTGGA